MLVVVIPKIGLDALLALFSVIIIYIMYVHEKVEIYRANFSDFSTIGMSVNG